MSALETAKEIGRIAATATLSKDVIDLLEKKVALVAEQISTLEREKSGLIAEKTNLSKKIANLEQQLDRLRPKGDLDVEAVKLLQLLAQQPGLRIGQIAGFLGVTRVKAEYHRDTLKSAKMIGFHGGIVELGNEGYELRAKGREYLAATVISETDPLPKSGSRSV
jgi:predicted nuclease with TOPRIM domain